jgi:hypothetical protein
MADRKIYDFTSGKTLAGELKTLLIIFRENRA